MRSQWLASDKSINEKEGKDFNLYAMEMWAIALA
jgi:hypothetical protein